MAVENSLSPFIHGPDACLGGTEGDPDNHLKRQHVQIFDYCNVRVGITDDVVWADIRRFIEPELGSLVEHDP